MRYVPFASVNFAEPFELSPFDAHVRCAIVDVVAFHAPAAFFFSR